jgi:hypothetical protein
MPGKHTFEANSGSMYCHVVERVISYGTDSAACASDGEIRDDIPRSLDDPRRSHHLLAPPCPPIFPLGALSA